MAVTLTPSVASPRAAIDAVRVDVAGVSSNDGASDTDDYPVQAELRAYIAFVKGGVELGRSYVFTVNSDGEHEFNNYIFPSSGAWSMVLHRASNDAVLKTQAITVT